MVRAFAVDGAGAAPRPSAAARDPGEAERTALRAEVERLGKALADAEQAADRAILAAHEKGRKAGLAEAADREDRRLAALRAGRDAAVEAFEARLAVLDGLAPRLARAALAKLFAGREDWAEMIEAMLALRLGRLRGASVVAIFVSPRDFADSDAIAALATGNARVEVDPELGAGVCRIETSSAGSISTRARNGRQLAQLLDEMAESA